MSVILFPGLVDTKRHRRLPGQHPPACEQRHRALDPRTEAKPPTGQKPLRAPDSHPATVPGHIAVMGTLQYYYVRRGTPTVPGSPTPFPKNSSHSGLRRPPASRCSAHASRAPGRSQGADADLGLHRGGEPDPVPDSLARADRVLGRQPAVPGRLRPGRQPRHQGHHLDLQRSGQPAMVDAELIPRGPFRCAHPSPASAHVGTDGRVSDQPLPQERNISRAVPLRSVGEFLGAA